MSTRKGRVVFLEDVLDRAAEKALKVVNEKNPDLSNAREIAEQIGVGAVVFDDLRRERIKDIEFDWDEIPPSRARPAPMSSTPTRGSPRSSARQ